MPAPPLESQVRTYLRDLMPREHAPSHLRLAFHDAGTYDARSNTGGAHGTVRLTDEVRRAENTGWGQECLALLDEAHTQFPAVSWADLVAVGAAAAVEKCGGPVIELGLGRTDGVAPSPTHRLPGGYEGVGLLKRMFVAKGLTVQDLVVLSGAHTLGHTQRKPFTPEPWVFSNSYYVQLLAQPELSSLPTDRSLLDDPELRDLVELYASDETRFRADFALALRRLTWLGNEPPAAT
jgi:L-ascorbate peroxidase